MKTSHTFTFSLLAALLVACGDDPNALLGASGGDPNAPPTTPTDPTKPIDPTDPALCTGREYVGLGAKHLESGRAVAKLGVDRGRLKPFGALQTEYPRVLGNTPASLAGSGPTFGAPPPRWYEEPIANAVALQTAYDIAFDGCLTYVAADPSMSAAPTAASAQTACAAMAQKFWSKTPSPTEITSCVDVAVTGAAGEPQVARKWAYACASVLTSAGFLSY
jgi:hypothetical protein